MGPGCWPIKDCRESTTRRICKIRKVSLHGKGIPRDPSRCGHDTLTHKESSSRFNVFKMVDEGIKQPSQEEEPTMGRDKLKWKEGES